MPKLHMLKSVTDTINTSLIFESESSLIVFDGGFAVEAEYLHEYLLNLGGHVDAWFLTHAHKDHVDACHAILSRYDDVTIDKLCKAAFAGTVPLIQRYIVVDIQAVVAILFGVILSGRGMEAAVSYAFT